MESYRAHTAVMLDAAVAAGVDWIDTARSYGRAEEFVGDWWRARAAADPRWADRAPTISSKWGYRYVGDWDMQAAVHEVKDHSLAHFRAQLALTRACLPRLNLYQVHSLTLDSPLFDDRPLLAALGELRDHGVAIGFSSSGPQQAEIIRRAMEIDVDEARLFSAVQATWNLLEPSAGPALREASRRELTVVVKESLANGRLVFNPPPRCRRWPTAARRRHRRGRPGRGGRQPWADQVLLGAAGVDQLHANLRADAVTLTEQDLAELAPAAMAPADYWAQRSDLARHRPMTGQPAPPWSTTVCASRLASQGTG
ncbi:MAG: aldo/keto reductase [Nakamurella multipartita]